MINLNEYYKEYNEHIEDEYNKSLECLKIILQDVSNGSINSKYADFFEKSARLIINVIDLEKNIDSKFFEINSLNRLQNINNNLYKELLEENYNKSYVNPVYAASVLGDQIGQLMSYVYVNLRKCIRGAYYHKRFIILENSDVLIELYDYIKNNNVIYNDIKKIVIENEYRNMLRNEEIKIKEDMSEEFTFLSDIICKSNLDDLRYLFKYGVYISDNELKLAQLVNRLSKEDIDKIADTIIQAYLKGFKAKNKDIVDRKVSRIIHIVGLERITKSVILKLEERGLGSVVSTLISKNINIQSDADHKFDNGLFIDEKYLKLKHEAYEEAMNNLSDVTKCYLGNIIQVAFGEENKSLKNNEESIKLSKEQLSLLQKNNICMKKTYEKFIPRSEVSYTGIAFPLAEIGGDYEQIFKDIVKINTVESDSVEKVQQTMIEALDKGEYVHIIGTGNNITNIKIHLNKLNDSEKESNFVNCGADVNIPVGEVFTSPKLNKSNGVLHLPEILISGIKYENLTLAFKDGYIQDFNCSNFDDEKENKDFIKKNLLFPHETLPIGEFAIGTNTYAYVLTKKHGIVDKLHTLIGEKMGPHIAIGDTCFAWSEDNKLYNLFSNKEIVAKDNERSILRKESIEKAYLNTHTDLTIPYEELGELSVITEKGDKISIIQNGKFVLEGTRELNIPLESE